MQSGDSRRASPPLGVGRARGMGSIIQLPRTFLSRRIRCPSTLVSAVGRAVLRQAKVGEVMFLFLPRDGLRALCHLPAGSAQCFLVLSASRHFFTLSPLPLDPLVVVLAAQPSSISLGSICMF